LFVVLQLRIEAEKGVVVAEDALSLGESCTPRERGAVVQMGSGAEDCGSLG
jgi:hypothetical protein